MQRLKRDLAGYTIDPDALLRDGATLLGSSGPENHFIS